MSGIVPLIVSPAAPASSAKKEKKYSRDINNFYQR